MCVYDLIHEKSTISLVFIVPIVLAEDKNPKTKWEILKAERLEKEAS
jgi:hypothetical protein